MTRYPKKPYPLTTDELLKLGVIHPEHVVETYTMGHTLTIIEKHDLKGSPVTITRKFKMHYNDESQMYEKGAWRKPEVKQG